MRTRVSRLGVLVVYEYLCWEEEADFELRCPGSWTRNNGRRSQTAALGVVFLGL